MLKIIQDFILYSSGINSTPTHDLGTAWTIEFGWELEEIRNFAKWHGLQHRKDTIM